MSLSFDWAIGTVNPANDPFDRVVYGFVNPGASRFVDVGAVEKSRYDASSDTFIYNFATKGYPSGTYSLRVTFPGSYGPDHSVTVGLR